MGMIFSAVGNLHAGRAEARASEYKAQVARNNQAIAEQNAKYAEQKGVAREQAVREGTAQVIGHQRAAFAGNNIDASSGSALRLQGDAARIGEIDALTTRDNAARAAYAWRVKGANLGAEAQLHDWSAGESKKAALLGFWSAGLGGATGFANKWDSWSKSDTGGTDSDGGSSDV